MIVDSQFLGLVANIAQIVSVIWVLLLGAKTLPDLCRKITIRKVVIFLLSVIIMLPIILFAFLFALANIPYLAHIFVPYLLKLTPPTLPGFEIFLAMLLMISLAIVSLGLVFTYWPETSKKNISQRQHSRGDTD